MTSHPRLSTLAIPALLLAALIAPTKTTAAQEAQALEYVVLSNGDRLHGVRVHDVGQNPRYAGRSLRVRAAIVVTQAEPQLSAARNELHPLAPTQDEPFDALPLRLRDPRQLIERALPQQVAGARVGDRPEGKHAAQRDRNEGEDELGSNVHVLTIGGRCPRGYRR